MEHSDERKKQRVLYHKKRRIQKHVNSELLQTRMHAWIELFIMYGGDKTDLQGIVAFIYSQENHRKTNEATQ